jgi:hypothetical protein
MPKIEIKVVSNKKDDKKQPLPKKQEAPKELEIKETKSGKLTPPKELPKKPENALAKKEKSAEKLPVKGEDDLFTPKVIDALDDDVKKEEETEESNDDLKA